MKKKLLDNIIIFIICFFIAPFAFFIVLNSSEFNQYNLYYNKPYYIIMYLVIAFSGFILLYVKKLIKYMFVNLVKSTPVSKAELISIEKIDAKSVNLGIIEVGIDFEDNYNIKFKHKNKMIKVTVSEEHIKKDLSKEEMPYVEYQYISPLSLFSKFHNVKVHTKNQRI